jgi:hypothetical protein
VAGAGCLGGQYSTSGDGQDDRGMFPVVALEKPSALRHASWPRRSRLGVAAYLQVVAAFLETSACLSSRSARPAAHQFGR